MIRSVLPWLRRWYVLLGRPPTALLCVALALTGAMYCTNDNFDADPAAPRGDGRYRPILARGDGHMHFLITRSIVFDRDLDFDNDLARFGDPWNQPRTVTGRKNVMQQIGPSMIWAPLLAAAHGLAWVANLFGAGIPTHGYTLFHQRILFTSSLVFAWLAVVLGLLLVHRLFGGRWGPVFAAVAVLLGTSLTYYATYMPSYAHAMDAAACAAFLATWVYTLGELRWRRYIVLGIWLGIAGMVRIQDWGFGAVLAIELVPVAWRKLREGDARAAGAVIARGMVTLAIALVLFVPQLWEWQQMYGSWWITPQGPGQMRYAHPMFAELLFSPRDGWLSNTPIAYLGVIGLAIGCIRGPRLGKHVRLVCGAMLVAVAIQVYVNAVTYEWWSAASFGQRRMCSVSLPLVVGLGALLRAAHVWIRERYGRAVQLGIAVAVLGYLVAWNLDWVRPLTDGKPAGRDNVPTCCDVGAPLSWVARPIYRVLGNPFELPASAWFALRHGVDLRRWDQVNGHYPLVPGVLGYEDGSYRNARATWNFIPADAEPYLLGGFGPPDSDGPYRYRWTVGERAELFLPQLMPEPHRVTMPIAANAGPGETVDVTVRFDGDEVAHALVGAAWTTITFDTSSAIGERTLSIEAAPRPYRGGPRCATQQPVGVAVGPLGLGLPPLPR